MRFQLRHTVLAAALAGVVALASACGGPEGYQAGTAWYARTGDPKVFTVFASVGACDEIERVETTQKEESVTVRIWARQATSCDKMTGIDRPVEIKLDRELGARAVLSYDGKTLLER